MIQHSHSEHTGSLYVRIIPLIFEQLSKLYVGEDLLVGATTYAIVAHTQHSTPNMVTTCYTHSVIPVRDNPATVPIYTKLAIQISRWQSEKILST